MSLIQYSLMFFLPQNFVFYWFAIAAGDTVLCGFDVVVNGESSYLYL